LIWCSLPHWYWGSHLGSDYGRNEGNGRKEWLEENHVVGSSMQLKE
jgi:hypothetical protein